MNLWGKPSSLSTRLATLEALARRREQARERDHVARLAERLGLDADDAVRQFDHHMELIARYGEAEALEREVVELAHFLLRDDLDAVRAEINAEARRIAELDIE